MAAVSEDESIAGYATRKAALRRQVEAAGTEAMMVFAADKVSKVRELAVEPDGSEAARLAATVSRTRQRRLTHYRHCLELLERHLADSPLVRQLRAELELRSAAPAPPPGARRRRLTSADPRGYPAMTASVSGSIAASLAASSSLRPHRAASAAGAV